VPGLLTATNDPNRAPEDLETGSRTILLNTYAKADFTINDRELTFGGDSIISDHMGEAIGRVCASLDASVLGLCGRIPNRISSSISTDVIQNLINGKTQLFSQGVPIDQQLVHYLIDPTEYAALMGTPSYADASVGGPTTESTILQGSLTPRMGVAPFPMQNPTVTHTTGTIARQATAQTGALVAATPVSSSSITIDGLTAGLTINVNDVFTIAGNPQKYVATTQTTVSAGGVATFSIWPNTLRGHAADTAVTFDKTPFASGSFSGLAMFHPKAFAVVPASLTTMGNKLGHAQHSVADPETGLNLRATISYDNSGLGSVTVKFDMLLGAALIDPQRAVLICRETA